MPRETLTAPLSLPLSFTSAMSRTSTTRTSPFLRIASTSAGCSFGTAAFAAASISFTVVAMDPLPLFPKKPRPTRPVRQAVPSVGSEAGVTGTVGEVGGAAGGDGLVDHLLTVQALAD